jgi:hypothetical protein
MEDLIYVFNAVCAILIIPLTNWLKTKLPNLSFIPPLVALVLAGIFVFGTDAIMGTHLDKQTLVMVVFGMQFISQIGYEAVKRNGGG